MLETIFKNLKFPKSKKSSKIMKLRIAKTYLRQKIFWSPVITHKIYLFMFKTMKICLVDHFMFTFLMKNGSQSYFFHWKDSVTMPVSCNLDVFDFITFPLPMFFVSWTLELHFFNVFPFHWNDENVEIMRVRLRLEKNFKFSRKNGLIRIRGVSLSEMNLFAKEH